MRWATVLGGLALGLAAFPAAHAQASGGPAYRDNLVACVMRAPGCRPERLAKADREYLRNERTSFTSNRSEAREIADARLSPPVRVTVSDDRLDRMHARDVRFELYRSRVRALRHGWIPGENAPYTTPPEGWADAYENWGSR